MPAITDDDATSDTLALPPTSAAGTRLARLMPGTAAEVMTAPLTMPSASEADSAMLPPTPYASVALAGHTGTIGCGAGPLLHALAGEAALRNAGATALKSVALLFASVQPPFARSRLVVALIAGAAAVSKKLAVP